MAARPSWRGHLRLALVSCPIRLIPAHTASEKIRFNKLNRDTGNRLRQQMIDPETDEVVTDGDIVMGYQFEKGRYVTVEKEELDELKIDSSENIEIERFVDADEIDSLYWDAPYIVQPDGKTGLDIFATLREAIRRKGVAGIGRVVMSRRERPVLIRARGKGMTITTLHDPDEVRLPESYFEEIKDIDIDKEYLAMAELLIDRKSGPFDPSLFEDRYQTALEKLIEAKIKGQEPVIPAVTEERPSNVVNLFDSLKASLDATEPKAARKPRAPSKTAEKKKGGSTKKPRRRRRA